MNAPWKAAGHNSREPFAAFVCDEATQDVVCPVVAEMGWPTEKCQPGGLRTAIQALSISASPQILLVDLSDSGDPLQDIGALAEVCEPGTVVIALGRVNDVRLYRDLLASGIHDYLLKPLSAEQLRDSLAAAQAIFLAPKNHEAQAARKHIASAVVGTRGGAGASTLATSIAWLLSTEHALPTALLDLDVHFGTGALALDLEPGRGLTDAIENPARIDGLFIERAMIRASERLAVLSAEAPLTQPLMTDGAAFSQLEDELRQAFEATVIDLPRNMLVNFPQLLGEVQVVVLATELTLASARDAIRILAWLKSHAPQARALVVANKVQSAAGEIARADFEASIERKLDYLVPFDPKAAARAAKLGQTFAEANPATKAGQVLAEIARAIRQTGDEDTPAPVPGRARKSLLAKLGELKGLRPRIKA